MAAFQYPKNQRDYQGNRGDGLDRSGFSIPVLVGAGLIATAILLSTLVTVVGTRFMGMDSPSEDGMWLIDRLTGSVYRCQATERGKASCDPDTATGSVGGQRKR